MVKGSHLTIEQKVASSILHKKVMNRSEVKTRCSVAAMGHTNSLGYRHTDEAKAKISTGHLNLKASPETCVKMSEHNWMKRKIGVLSPFWKGGIQISSRKTHYKRRNLGFNPLNAWFPGCEAHHINLQDVIYIPAKLHQSIRHNVFTGKNMDKINVLAFAWYTEDWT